MAKLKNILAWEWQAWDGFLISHLLDNSSRLSADYYDDCENLLARVSPHIEAVLLQINLTMQMAFPRERDALIGALKRRGLYILNEHVSDISKSSLQQHLVDVGLPSVQVNSAVDDETLLFVKSNLNWGGEVERRLDAAVYRTVIGQPQGAITAFDQYYKVRKKELPNELWRDPSLSIERFISNNEDAFYRIYCFGEALVVVKAHSSNLIKKICGDHRDYNILCWRSDLQLGAVGDSAERLPNRLREVLTGFIASWPLDYFCLDIVFNTDRPDQPTQYYIVDLNTTPYSGEGEQTGSAVAHLCEGANRWLQQLRAA